MRCHICNSQLSSIVWNRDHGDFDPCGTCLAVIAEVFPDEPDEPEIEQEIEPTAEELMADAEDAALGRFGS